MALSGMASFWRRAGSSGFQHCLHAVDDLLNPERIEFARRVQAIGGQ